MTMRRGLMNKLGRFARREDGTQVLEFAVVFPFLFILFAGAVELGRMHHQYTTLSKGTRAAARYLSNVESVANSTAAAQNLALCGSVNGCGGENQPEVMVPGLTASNVVITPPAVEIGGVNYVTVEIDNYTYTPLVFNLNAMLGTTAFTVELDPSTTMRRMR